MTKIKFIKKNNNYTALHVSGHTGYAEHGQDILCASVSSIVQSGALGIIKVLGIDASIERNDEKGLFIIQLPEDMSMDKYSESNIIFETMYVSLSDLASGYKKFIKLEEVCDVY